MESACLHGRGHLIVEHEVPDVGGGEHDALVPRESVGLADLEEALDFLGHSADRLHDPLLVDRAGHRQPLRDRRAR